MWLSQLDGLSSVFILVLCKLPKVFKLTNKVLSVYWEVTTQSQSRIADAMWHSKTSCHVNISKQHRNNQMPTSNIAKPEETMFIYSKTFRWSPRTNGVRRVGGGATASHAYEMPTWLHKILPCSTSYHYSQHNTAALSTQNAYGLIKNLLLKTAFLANRSM